MQKTLYLLLLNSYFLFGNIITLDLNTAIDIALKNNKQKKLSKIAYEVAKIQYKQALSANYPTLDLEMIATRMDEETTFNMKGKIPISVEANDVFLDALYKTGDISTAQNIANSTNLKNIPSAYIKIDEDFELMGRDNAIMKLQLKYPLYTGGKIQSIINQAKLNKDIKAQEINLQDDEIIFLIKQIYYGYILEKNIYQIMENSYLRMIAIEELTKKLYKNESLNIKKTDFLKTKLTVSLMKAKLEEYKSNIQLTKNALKNILAIEYADDIQILENNLNIEDKKNLNKNIDSLYKQALLYNPLINKINLAVKVQDEKIDEAISQYYPTIALFANTSKFYNDGKGLYTDENKNNWMIGITANLNIFSGFKSEYELLEQKLNKKKMQVTKELVNNSILLALQNALVKNKEIYINIENYKQANIVAIEHRDLNLKAYKIDLVDTKEVIESQLIQTKAEVLYFKALYDYIISNASIDKLLSRR